MSTSKIVVRIGTNPNHHFCNNHGTLWLHYTEHLTDYTKRRVRRSLHTHNVRAARAIRDVLLDGDISFHSTPTTQAAAA